MSNLLEKASIVTTPTAYDNGKILSVKPSVVLGEELVTNGDFSNGSAGWTIINGTVTDKYNASMTSYQSGIRIAPFSKTGTFKVVFDLVVTSGSCKFDAGGSNNAIFNTSGTKEIIVTNTTKFEFNAFNLGWVGTLDNVSVKEEIDGDFDFTRNSSATRVNSQGLIEDVQILSSNLVSNGDFSQEGSELITNGDFSNGVNNWAQGSEVSSFTVTNGIATIQGNASSFNTRISQSISVTIGKTYKITGEIKSNDAGDYRVRLFNGSYLDITNGNNSEFQTFTYYHNATTSTAILYLSSYYSNGSADFSIDNVSVKEVGQDWNSEQGIWTFGDSVVNGNGANGSSQELTQSAVTTVGKNYNITYEVLNYVSGSVQILGSEIGYVSGNGVYTSYYSASSSTLKFRPINFNGSITNVSVIEITEDTNLPRIDYTGGEGHWLFEPQSTNLITYSEVYGSGTYFSSFQGSTFDNTTSLSPSGENNATQLTSTGAGKLQTSGISLSQNTDYTLSFYAKNVDATEVTSRVLGLGGSGGSNLTPISYFNELSTTEWKRITHSFNTGTNTTFYLYLLNALNSGGTIQIWGAQLEQSSFATSIIPTNGSTVTRLQDASFGAGSSDLINSTEGVLYAEIAALSENYTGRRFITLNDATASNGAVLRYEASGVIVARYQISGIAQCSIAFAATITNYHKIAFKYSLNDFALWVDGVEVGVDSSGNVLSDSVLNNIDFNSGNGTFPFFGKAKCLAVFKEALTDAELTCLTTI